MAKKKETFKPNIQAKKETEEPKKNKVPKYIFFTALGVIAVFFIVYNNWINPEKPPTPKPNYPKVEQPKTDTPPAQEPQFKKQGMLDFLSSASGSTLKKIEIELAENDSTREKGLMWRKTMDDAQGMLFIFPVQEIHSFWMKNTVLSLDILFVNSDFEIVKIHKKAEPYSTKSLPSMKPSIYVVEVNGGFCDKYGVKEGDKIKFKKQ